MGYCGAVKQRWVAQLAGFQFDVKYQPGRTNGNADALSRWPSEDTAGEGEEAATPADVVVSVQSDVVQACLHAFVPEDPGTMGRGPSPRERAAEGQATQALLRKWDRLCHERGLLCRDVCDKTGEKIKQVVVHQCLQKQVLLWLHDQAGPLGAEKVLTMAQRPFFGRGMAWQWSTYRGPSSGEAWHGNGPHTEALLRERHGMAMVHIQRPFFGRGMAKDIEGHCTRCMRCNHQVAKMQEEVSDGHGSSPDVAHLPGASWTVSTDPDQSSVVAEGV
ncbi:hypothetical protein ACEWY4_000210 [Coilia grayii]|uniref:Integrase zinc-binding domain-containing protein n=1 Tax=Coilia grayii TaxID=363190 RepID=A0ABD1KW06_9TELE